MPRKALVVAGVLIAATGAVTATSAPSPVTTKAVVVTSLGRSFPARLSYPTRGGSLPCDRLRPRLHESVLVVCRDAPLDSGVGLRRDRARQRDRAVPEPRAAGGRSESLPLARRAECERNPQRPAGQGRPDTTRRGRAFHGWRRRAARSHAQPIDRHRGDVRSGRDCAACIGRRPQAPSAVALHRWARTIASFRPHQPPSCSAVRRRRNSSRTSRVARTAFMEVVPVTCDAGFIIRPAAPAHSEAGTALARPLSPTYEDDAHHRAARHSLRQRIKRAPQMPSPANPRAHRT